MELARDAGGLMPGTPTGFPDLDDATFGLHRSDLVIIAGRPSMGKSALDQAIAPKRLDAHR